MKATHAASPMRPEEGSPDSVACALCHRWILVRAGQRPRFCSDEHRKAHHRLRARHGEGSALNAAMRQWREAHVPSRQQAAEARLELTDALRDLRMPSLRRVRAVAEDARELCDILDRVDELRWVLDDDSAGAADIGAESALTTLDHVRAAIRRLADLDDVADELENNEVPEALARLAQLADGLELAPDEDEPT